MHFLLILLLVVGLASAGRNADARTLTTEALGEDVITTKQMGNAADMLVTRARCQDVTRAFSQAARPDASKQTRMSNVAFVTYAFGYAQGRGLSFPDAVAELLAYCREFPDRPFAGFPD